jgi:hypothetical protein
MIHRGLWVLAGTRQIVEPSLQPIQIPLAGRIECLAHVLHPIDPGVFGETLEKREKASSVEGHRAICDVHAFNWQMLVVPGRNAHDFNVVQIVPSLDVGARIDEAFCPLEEAVRLRVVARQGINVIEARFR